ncbi:phosphate ABC transport system ATP-binding protein PstB [Clostridium aceticum]|uniref:Phosphate ABC transport system ATP-binding protein PstB n=1 Tax=Clostridium aceticum TaxID=84022 RepID=A0A0D8IDP6_9CLOT|nr:phosphate ABC transporter ATP-binding protein [Clostridium aceticum]AKL94376.1 phosphate ABC transport system ATP-binding protein PstB [Clostridium aceticum]KJF28393.1 ABC transporter [Clostridium aceticum]
MDLTSKDLTKSYKERKVLDIDALHIESGAFLGIIGPNGAGKSTLVKILAGLDTPTTGVVKYDGVPLNTRIHQKMTMVFQKPYLLRTSVFNNIAYPLKIRKVNKNKIQQQVDDLIEEMDIQHIRNQNAWTLSGGEAQKVALARAIIFQPSLLILDEPTASIDPASTLVLEKTVKNFYNKTKATIIIVTHNLQQAKRLCDDVAFMHKGKILEYGKTEDVILFSKNHLIRQFVEGEIIL